MLRRTSLHATVARHDRGGQREVATGTFAGNGNARRVAVERRRILEHPCVRSHGVVMRGRKLVLRRLSIFDRDDYGVDRRAVSCLGARDQCDSEK